MADEPAKTEETKVEDTEALDSAIKKGEEETKDEIPEEVLELNKTFDDKMDADDDEDDSVADDTPGDKKPEEKAEEKTDVKPAEGAEEKAAEKTDAGKTEDAAKTVEEKEIDEAAKAIEEQLVADAGKTAQQKETEAAAKKAADDAKAAEEAKAKEADKYTSDLDPDNWDDDAIAMDTKRGQQALDQQKALQSQNDELRTILVQQANQRHGDWLDGKVNALGKNFHEVLGEGEFEDLEPASVQADNRIKIGNRMATIQQAHQKLNKTVPSRNKLFDKAVTDLFNKEKNKSKTEAETAAKLRLRAGQVLGGVKGKASALSAASDIVKSNAEFDAKMDED